MTARTGKSRSFATLNQRLRGTAFAALASSMRVLEARFHPRGKRQPDIVVIGNLVWRREGRRGAPALELGTTTISETMLSKLRYLIALSQPDCYERLQSLHSEFWSFVSTAADDKSE